MHTRFPTVRSLYDVICCRDINYHDLVNIDLELMAEDIKPDITDVDTLDILVEKLEDTLRSALEKHAPQQTKSVENRHKVSWFTEEVRDAKKWMRHREKMWRKYSTEDLWTAFKVVRWQYKTSIRKVKCEILSNKIQNCKGDTRKLYTLVPNLTGTNPENPLPKSDNMEKLADEFADFILEKIQKIRSELDEHPIYQPERCDVPNLAEFFPMYDKEILKIMYKMQTKQCELYAIPTAILKNLRPYIRDIITKIVNASLSDGKFTSQWKITSIKLLLKNLGLELLSNNYRPVSNLSFLLKLVEKCMLSQFNDHCNFNQLIPTHQSAYRAFHSCEHLSSTYVMMLCVVWKIRKSQHLL